MMDFCDVLAKRHSIRAFLSKPVEQAKLNRILEAANSAPSAGNLQAYEIFVIKDEAKKKAIAATARGQKFIATAPVVLIFCAAPQRAREYGKRGETLYALQDATIAAAFAWLAVVAEGLGAVWVGAFDDEAALKVIGAKGLVPCAIMPIGYPAEKPERTERRGLGELVHEL